jgi:hypothetical protein
MRFYFLALGILAVWRVTHLLNAEDGPWDVLARFRGLFGHSVGGALLDCFYCLSLWIAAPFAWWLGGDWKERLLLWPALSAGAILAERLTTARAAEPAPPVIYYDDSEEDRDVMLRQQAGSVPASEPIELPARRAGRHGGSTDGPGGSSDL